MKHEKNKQENKDIAERSTALVQYEKSECSQENPKVLKKKHSTVSLKSKTVLQNVQSASDFSDWAPPPPITEFHRSGSPGPDEESLSRSERNFKSFKGNATQRFKGNNRTELGSLAPDSMQFENVSLQNYLSIAEQPSDKLVRRGSFSRQTIKSKSLIRLEMTNWMVSNLTNGN